MSLDSQPAKKTKRSFYTTSVGILISCKYAKTITKKVYSQENVLHTDRNFASITTDVGRRV